MAFGRPIAEHPLLARRSRSGGGCSTPPGRSRGRPCSMLDEVWRRAPPVLRALLAVPPARAPREVLDGGGRGADGQVGDGGAGRRGHPRREPHGALAARGDDLRDLGRHAAPPDARRARDDGAEAAHRLLLAELEGRAEREALERLARPAGCAPGAAARPARSGDRARVPRTGGWLAAAGEDDGGARHRRLVACGRAGLAAPDTGRRLHVLRTARPRHAPVPDPVRRHGDDGGREVLLQHDPQGQRSERRAGHGSGQRPGVAVRGRSGAEARRGDIRPPSSTPITSRWRWRGPCRPGASSASASTRPTRTRRATIARATRSCSPVRSASSATRSCCRRGYALRRATCRRRCSRRPDGRLAISFINIEPRRRVAGRGARPALAGRPPTTGRRSRRSIRAGAASRRRRRRGPVARLPRTSASATGRSRTANRLLPAAAGDARVRPLSRLHGVARRHGHVPERRPRRQQRVEPVGHGARHRRDD